MPRWEPLDIPPPPRFGPRCRPLSFQPLHGLGKLATIGARLEELGMATRRTPLELEPRSTPPPQAMPEWSAAVRTRQRH